MTSSIIKNRLQLILALVRFQRMLRLILRFAWLGLGGYLIYWGIQKLSSRLFSQNVMSILGISLGLLLFVSIIIRWQNAEKILWSVDRKFDLKEQTSTAWQVIIEKEKGVLNEALFTDVMALSPVILKGLLLRGWFLVRDLVSLCIVAILVFGVYKTSGESQYLDKLSSNVNTIQLPAVPSEMRAEDILPMKIPGLASKPNPQNADNPNENQSNHQIQLENQQGLSEGDFKGLSATVDALGKALSQNAATYGAGQAMQSMDLGKAAGAFQTLSDRLGSLDNSTLEQIAASLKAASTQLKNTNLDQLANDLQGASDSINTSLDSQKSDQNQGLDSQDSLLIRDQLDQVAKDINQIESNIASASNKSGSSSSETTANFAGPGAGASSSGRLKSDPAGLTRLQGEGGTLELPNANPHDITGIPTQGGTDKPGTGVSQQESSAVNPGSGEVIQTFLVPFNYPYKWRDVISTYFQRYR
jgi:hypothetical protein